MVEKFVNFVLLSLSFIGSKVPLNTDLKKAFDAAQWDFLYIYTNMSI